MRRSIAVIAAACVCLLISTGAFAQVPSNPDNPNDVVPDALTPPPYGEPINLETAKKVAAAAVAETAKRNWNAFCIAVVNPAGELVYFEKQDNCQYASIGLSQHKARTATRYRRPTLAFENLMGKGPPSPISPPSMTSSPARRQPADGGRQDRRRHRRQRRLRLAGQCGVAGGTGRAEVRPADRGLHARHGSRHAFDLAPDRSGAGGGTTNRPSRCRTED